MSKHRQDFKSLLGTELPVIQSPMAGVQAHGLALAVCEAGGLGSLPGAMLSPEALQRELTALATGTSRPYNLNFFCHTLVAPNNTAEQAWRDALAPFYQRWQLPADQVNAAAMRTPFSHDLADLIAPFKPPVVSFHFGLPAPDLLARVKAWGATVLASATTVDEARWLQARGADAVIAQGLEAGGHRGHFLRDDLGAQMGTLALVPQVVAAIDLPVIAAGGIADAAGVAAAQALGASAVQVGTVFLLCPEAHTTTLHRAALQGPGARHTEITRLFTGRPARSIVNALMRELGAMNPLAPAFPTAASALAPLRAAAELAGISDFTPLWAGQNTSGCRAVAAAEITRALAAGWR